MSIDSTIARPMTMAREANPEKSFVSAVLPWLIAGVALLFYLLTLNHWLSFSSLLPVARTSGWVWQPSLTDPLYWLVTFPLSWFPAAAIPVLLNLFSAVCAALTLALLARSVSLLPHDRTKEQRIREGGAFSLLSIPAAWVPPVVAAAVCGLQLSFWENATVASIEMFNLLLFAYVIRCLLEYRIDERESWLFRAALIYGAGMANNWAMIGFFPVFVVAVIWIKGKGIFNGGFLGRMFISGVVGLSLYLLLPILIAVRSNVDVGFWQALKSNLSQQKTFLAALVFNKDSLINGDRPLWVLGLPSLLPLLAVSIRLPSFMGDINKIGVALTNLGFHVINGVLMVVCLWVALDPGFSPRHYQPLLGTYGIHLLTFYYLGALSIGYFVGYFLLVFGVTPSGRQRFRKTYPRFVNHTVVALTYALIIVVPVLLICRNFGQIRRTNGPQLRQYAALVTEKLPSSGGFLISDDPRRLLLLQSALTQAHKARDFILLDSASLEYADYHRYLKKVHPTTWQSVPPQSVKQLSSAAVQGLVFQLAQSNSVFYLHPSFGYYFEVLYPTPHGLLQQLSAYPQNAVLAPAIPAEIVTENEAFWSKADDVPLSRLAAAIAADKPVEQLSALEKLARAAHLAVETNRDAVTLGSFYSEGLNSWGVQMQRQNQLPQAAAHFSRALELKPDNVVAEVNLDCNRKLQAGKKTTVLLTKDLEDKFGHRTWDQIMRENGPFDEPTFCFAQGNALWQGGNDHQAALQFERVRALEPDNFPARLALAQIYYFHRLPDATLAVVKEIHANVDPVVLQNHTNLVQILGLETSAHLSKGEVAAAQSAVEGALAKAPRDPDLLAAASKVYMDFGYYTNALVTINQQLQSRPDDPGALFSKGNACLQLNLFADAIEPLTKVLRMETNNFSKAHYLAQFMRAKAYLGQQRLDLAKADYEVLHQALPKEFPVYFDLGNIAYREKDTNAAIRNYELYKANAPTNLTTELELVNTRLAELKHGSP
jgi:tetratricopeptide (TPR) repeat protein